ncbi:MAG: hypothetical protein WC511_02700 [Candidatus Pacearchaeota archaeon]
MIRKYSDLEKYEEGKPVPLNIWPESDKYKFNKLVETPEFKSWFGSSVVTFRDEYPFDHRMPMPVYHITSKDFKEFVPGGGNPAKGLGIYFGPSKWRDKLPAFSTNPNEKGSRVIPVYLKIEEPLRILSGVQWEQVKKDLNLYNVENQINGFPFVINSEIMAKLRKWGADGLIFSHDAITAPGKKEPQKRFTPDEYVVFDSTQIKSVYGNKGEFRLDSSDITGALKK